MDLFSLVARLTLDSSEYEQGLSEAEAQAAGFGGDVDAKVDLDHEEYDEGIDEAEEKGEEFAGSFEDIAARISGALVGAGIVATVGKIASAFKDAVNDAATYADTVDKTSRRLSMSTDAYQVWQHALSQSGADISNVTRGWLNLTDAVTGGASDEVAMALQSLAIEPSEFASTEQLFDTVINSLAEIGSGAERDSLVTALFGRGGNQLNALLDSGAKGIEDLKQEAYDLGLVMSGEDIAAGVAYGDALANMNAAVEALKQNVVSGLFPVLTDAISMVTDLVAWLNPRNYETTLQDEFENISAAEKKALSDATADKGKVDSLLDSLYSMTDAEGKATGNLELWKGMAQEVINICPELASAIDPENLNISKQRGEVDALTQAWYDNAKAQAMNTALQSRQTAIAEKIAEITNATVDAEIKRAEADGKRRAAAEALIEKYQSMGGTDDVSHWMDADIQTLETLAKAYALTDKDMQGVLDTLNEAYDINRQIKDTETSIASMQAQVEQATSEYELAQSVVQAYIDKLNGIPSEVTTNVNLNFNSDEPEGSHAKGLNYVPYDGYTAVLHRGETVLNQAQARDWRQGYGGSFDANQMAQLMGSAVRGAVLDLTMELNGVTVGRVVGDTTTHRVSDNISQIKKRHHYGVGG